MAKNNVFKALAGLAVAGAAVGGALAYIKKCKDVDALSEEDFDDLLNDDEEESEPQKERTYTTLPKEDVPKAEETDEADAESETADQTDAEAETADDTGAETEAADETDTDA